MPRRKITAAIDRAAAKELPELTGQQQEFVRLILAGKTGADAYRGAYDCRNMLQNTVIAAASRLRADPNIAAWLLAAREAHLGTTVLTRDMHLAELERLKELALASGNHGAAIQAESFRGKVAGHHVERFQEIAADPADSLKELATVAPELAAQLAALHGLRSDDDRPERMN